MADGGSVTVQYKADASQFYRETDRAKQSVGRFQAALAKAAQNDLGAKMSRAAIGIGAVGIAANVVGRNLQELGDQYSTVGRIGGFLSNLTSGNLVGAFKSLSATAPLAKDEVEKLSSAYTKNVQDVYAAVAAYEKLGIVTEEVAAKIRAARVELAAGYALAYATFGGGTGAAASPDSRGGPMGPGARAFEQPAPKPGPVFGLPIRNQVALEAARAAGDRQGLIRQIQRAENLLSKQLQNEKLTDKDRLGIYSTINALNAELESLTKKKKVRGHFQILPFELESSLAKAKGTERTDDDLKARERIVKYLENRISIETNANKKIAMVRRLGQERAEIARLMKEGVSFSDVQTASLVGALGQGPFLTSPLFQYAQSYGYKAKPQDFLRDLREQVRDATRFSKNLDLIGRRGGSKNIVGELASQGQTGEEIAAALAKNPKLIRQYSSLADKRAAIAEKLQVQSMQVTAASVVVNAKGKILGVDRNGNGVLEREERFTVMNGGTPRTHGTRRGGV